MLGEVYKKIAIRLTDYENHRTENQYEDSLIQKIFWFTFVNSVAPCFILAFWDKNAQKLAFQLMTILIGKQIALNLVEYISYRYLTGRKINKVTASFKTKIKDITD